MKLTNQQIYTRFIEMEQFLQSYNDYISIKIAFYIQKNFQNLKQASELIEMGRNNIVKNYGVINDDEIEIKAENKEMFLKELEDLFSIEQDLDIKMIKLEDLGNIQLTPVQMQALMFMIED